MKPISSDTGLQQALQNVLTDRASLVAWGILVVVSLALLVRDLWTNNSKPSRLLADDGPARGLPVDLLLTHVGVEEWMMSPAKIGTEMGS